METVNHKIIKPKIGLLNLAEELDNVSQACRIMGYSRDTFYRYKHPIHDLIQLWRRLLAKIAHKFAEILARLYDKLENQHNSIKVG